MLYFGCQLDPVHLTKHLRGICESEHKKKTEIKNPLFAPSLQSFLYPSSTLGCLRARHFPLHFRILDAAYPHCVSCPLPHRPVGQS